MQANETNLQFSHEGFGLTLWDEVSKPDLMKQVGKTPLSDEKKTTLVLLVVLKSHSCLLFPSHF